MASAEKLKEIKDEYTSSLSDLTINSKPLINMLTMLAEDNIENASVIVQAVEEHLEKVRSEYKLPVLYLIDSIVKNVGDAYATLFTQNIVANFCSVFEKVDERTRSSMFKLRQTWSEVFPAKKMYTLDVRVNAIDPAWPIIAPQPTPSIHVNPKFFNKTAGSKSGNVVAPVVNTVTNVVTPTATAAATTSAVSNVNVPSNPTLDMRAQLINKQKELLELQQRKIELELLHAKVKLEEQQQQFAAQQQQKSSSSTGVTSNTTQKKNVPSSAIIVPSTTTQTTTLPSMKTILTKPNALPSSKSTVESKSSTKQSSKLSTQSGQAFSTLKSSSSVNGPTTMPRIAPVNSALVASAVTRNVSRDPRLAAKQAAAVAIAASTNTIAVPVSVAAATATSGADHQNLNIKSKIETVNFEKVDKRKLNNNFSIETNNKSNKSSLHQPTTSSLNIKDPRLISSKVHGSIGGGSNISKGKSNVLRETVSSNRSTTNATTNKTQPTDINNAVSLANSSPASRKLSKKHRSKSSDLNKIVDLTETKTSYKRGSDISNKSSRTLSTSPTKSKRIKEHSSPVKKSPELKQQRSPDKYKSQKSRHVNKYNNVDMDLSPATHSRSSSPVDLKADDKSISGGGNTTVNSFKDVKISTKNRNYIRRNRAQSHSPSESSNVHDIDLRIGVPPEKQPRLHSPKSPGQCNSESIDKIRTNIESSSPKKSVQMDQSIIALEVTASTKDVDLRQLPPTVTAQSSALLAGKKRPSGDKILDASSNAKKSKAEMFDVLFGDEDVDLRQLPPPNVAVIQQQQPPTPPPPPVISSPPTQKSSSGNDKQLDNSGWQKVKENRTTSPTVSGSSDNNSSSNLATVRAKLANATSRDRLGRPLLYNKLTDSSTDHKRASSSTGDIDLRQKQPVKTNAASIKLFLQEAEENRKSGKMSADQYQNAMEQVIAIVERQKLRKAKRMESRKDSTPKKDLSPVVYSISDDELSADFSEDDDDDDRPQQQLVRPLSPENIEITDSNDVIHVSSSSPKSNFDDTHRKRFGGKMERDRRRDRWNNTKWDHQQPVMPQQQQRSNPWIHPPLGLIEKQNPFAAGPWKQSINFMPQIPSIGGGMLPVPPLNNELENRPNVAVGGFVQVPPLSRYEPRATSPPPLGSLTSRELPHADPAVIEYINNDSMRTINIDGNPTEIRYYGETAVTLKGDEAIEIAFQGGTRRITFGDKESYVLSFNDAAREVLIAGVPHRVRLGAPTRELYIDDKWYECFFGGPGIVIEIDREYKIVKLEGPPPQVKLGKKRNDLCVGRINLIINAKNIVPIYLDAKPQKFDIESKMHWLRFADALQTVIINDEPFKVDFGGLPKPIIVHGKKHFIRFTRLPPGIRPGYINIKDMEGHKYLGATPPCAGDNENSMEAASNSLSGLAAGLAPTAALPTVPTINNPPVPNNEPVLPMVGKRRPVNINDHSEDSQDNRISSPQPSTNIPVLTSNFLSNFNLDLLSSIIKPAMAPSSNINASGYNTNLPISSTDSTTEIPGLGGLQTNTTSTTSATTTAITEPVQPQTPAIGLTAPPRSFEELKNLIQKLEATGILSNVSDSLQSKEPKLVNDVIQQPQQQTMNTIKPVDFTQPETLKIKQPVVVHALYSGMQCSSCGVRFPPEHTVKYSRQHLDWHYRQNKKKKHSIRKANSRKWFYDVSDWIQFEEIEDLEEREKSWFENQQLASNTGDNAGSDDGGEEEEIPSVDARSAGNNPRCEVCYDSFDQFYNEEKEEWHLRMAIRVEDKLYHPLCYEDYKTSLADASTAANTALEVSTIEIRDEADDDDVNINNDDDEVIETKDPNALEPIIVALDDDDDNKSIDDDDNSKKEIIIEDSTENSQLTSDELEKGALSPQVESSVAVENKLETINNEDDDNLDTSENDVCIILPEEIPIVKIDDRDDDEDDVFNESEIEKPKETKYKMIDVVMDDGTIVKIKSEPLDLDLDEPSEDILASTADNTNAAVVSSIDGNVQLEPTVNISSTVPSGRIKINISKPLSSNQQQLNKNDNSTVISDNLQQKSPQHSPLSTTTTTTTTDLLINSTDNCEPPPPGEEPPLQIKLKPALQGVKLKVMPPVSKGSELSGLCSIM